MLNPNASSVTTSDNTVQIAKLMNPPKKTHHWSCQQDCCPLQMDKLQIYIMHTLLAQHALPDAGAVLWTPGTPTMPGLKNANTFLEK